MGSRAVASILAVVVLAACTTGLSDRGPASQSVSPTPAAVGTTSGPTEPVSVRCGDDIGGHSPLDDDSYVVIDSAVALPSTDRPALQAVPVKQAAPDGLPPGEWFWAKQGLVVSGGDRIHLRVAPEAGIRIGWGHAPSTPSTSVTVECSQHTDWLAFPGGYLVRELGCYTIHVQVNNHHAREVHVGIGAPCTGQQPPVES
jgi:hypothetical protein